MLLLMHVWSVVNRSDKEKLYGLLSSMTGNYRIQSTTSCKVIVCIFLPVLVPVFCVIWLQRHFSSTENRSIQPEGRTGGRCIFLFSTKLLYITDSFHCRKTSLNGRCLGVWDQTLFGFSYVDKTADSLVFCICWLLHTCCLNDNTNSHILFQGCY